MTKYFQSEHELERFLDKQIATDCIEGEMCAISAEDTDCYIHCGSESLFDDVNFYRFH